MVCCDGLRKRRRQRERGLLQFYIRSIDNVSGILVSFVVVFFFFRLPQHDGFAFSDAVHAEACGTLGSMPSPPLTSALSCNFRKRDCRKATGGTWKKMEHITRDISLFSGRQNAFVSCIFGVCAQEAGIGSPSVRFSMSAADPCISSRLLPFRVSIFFRWKTLWRLSCPSPGSLVVKLRLRLQVFYAFLLYLVHI